MSDLCQRCKNLDTQRAWAQSDLSRLRRVAARAKQPDNIAALLATAKAEAERTEVEYQAHVADEHDGVPHLGAPKSTVGVWRYRGDKVPCPLCGVRVGAKLRRSHRSPSGLPCPGVERTRTLTELAIAEAPPVRMPLPRGRAQRSDGRPERRPVDEPSRLDAGSSCRACGKWLPGERSLCGRCSVRRAS